MTHSSTLFAADNIHGGLRNQESLRSLIRAVSKHEKEIMAACDLNQYNLCFLAQQIPPVVEDNEFTAEDESTEARESFANTLDPILVVQASKKSKRAKL